MSRFYNALITTHHITSRKKVQRLKDAARNLRPLYIVLCSGGSPGIMYAEGGEQNVCDWVASVKRLKYKDFHLARRPAVMEGRVNDEPIHELREQENLGLVAHLALCHNVDM